MRTCLVVISLVACSKPSTEQKAGSGAPPPAPAAPNDSSAAPSEPAAVVGPTRSATGVLDISGAMTGIFEWKKKDQTEPISCAWNAEKKLGGLHIDLSDGAGQLIKLNIDVPPQELGKPRLDAMSTKLPGPLKTYSDFTMTGDDAGHITVTFDTTLSDTVPDPATETKAGKKAAKQADKPSGPTLTIKGTLEVNCPPKK